MRKADKKTQQDNRRICLRGEINGIYARNHWGVPLRPLPIDDKSFQEIVDHIAPHYIVLSCAEWDEFKEAIKIANKVLAKKPAKALRVVFNRFATFLS